MGKKVDRSLVMRLHQNGLSQSDIARQLGVSYRVINLAFSELGLTRGYAKRHPVTATYYEVELDPSDIFPRGNRLPLTSIRETLRMACFTPGMIWKRVRDGARFCVRNTERERQVLVRL